MTRILSLLFVILLCATQASAEDRLWRSDRHFAGGNVASWGSIAIAGTTDDTVYQTERWFPGGGSYNIPIANGDYTVTIHASENAASLKSVGARVFHVDAEGVRRITDYDIYVDAGNAGATATTESFNVTVTDGELNIQLVPKVQNPKVDGIQIEAATPVPPESDFPMIVASAPTAIETSSSGTIPSYGADDGGASDTGTPDTTDVVSTTAAVGETILLLIGGRDTDGTDTVTSFACDGSQTATRLAAATRTDSGVRIQLELWGVLSNTTANPTCTATWGGTGPNQSFVEVDTVTGVDSFGASGINNGSSNNWDVSITTNRANSLIYAAGALRSSDAGPFTPDDTETERGDGAQSCAGAPGNCFAHQRLTLSAASAGANNLGGLGDTSVPWAAVAIELRSALGGATAFNLASGGTEGDLHIACAAAGGSANITTPEGWGTFSNISGASFPNNAGRIWCFNRTQTATWPAGATTVPFTMSADQQTAWLHWIIESHRNSVTALHGAHNGGQITDLFDPPSVNTSTGQPEDIMVFALAAADENSNIQPFWPESYSELGQVASSSTTPGAASLNVVLREVRAQTEDPGVIPYGASEEGIAATFFVYGGNEGEGTAPTQPPTCSPSSQSALVAANVTFNASAGDGSFSWSAPGGSPSSGTGATFQTSYSTTGNKTVTVTSAGLTAQCLVTVNAAPPTACSATGHYQVIDNRICDPSGNELAVTSLRGGDFQHTSDYTGAGTASYITYLGPTTCWKIPLIRLGNQPMPSDGSLSSSIITAIDDLTAEGFIVMPTWQATAGHCSGCATPDSTTPDPGDQDDIETWFNALSDRYGTRGTNPNELVWYDIYNEWGHFLSDAAVSGGTVIFDPADVADWQRFHTELIAEIRDKADAPIIVSSMMQAGDVLRHPSTGAFQFSQGANNFSSVLKHGQTILNYDANSSHTSSWQRQNATPNIIWDVHLYGSYNATTRKTFMAEFLAEIEARGQMAFFGEYASHTGSGVSVIQSARNMRDLRLGNADPLGSFYFVEGVWALDGPGANHLTTTDGSDSDSDFGVRDITGTGSPAGCTVPNNLTELGQILWDGVH